MINKRRDQHKNFLSLSIAALGVVYGDIGTSPLYALRESLRGLPVIPQNVFGILSLIFWALILIISIKYLVYILRVDNDGEGGVLALLTLLKEKKSHYYQFFFMMGILGAGLLLGDGMLTPAISVLSAVEGLEVISPNLSRFVLPITALILLIIFLFQQHGTTKIGKYFGPIILIWFLTLGLLGGYRIMLNPSVIQAIHPYYAIAFFQYNGWTGYFLLGGVFLVVTGGEALYAALGHFGKVPIRIGWFAVALPGLILNYFGQGAYLLQFPDAIHNPFYAIAPGWFSYPLLIIATLATIIASQAVISATFSITKQAILLDLYPRLPIVQTSEKEKGQIYVPQMNFMLALGAFILIFTFKHSSALTHAYGIAVNLEMFILTLIVARVIYVHWQWSLIRIASIFSGFILIDLFFLGANMHKIETGGWVPLLFAGIAGFTMMTWKKGLEYLRLSYYKEKEDLKEIINQLDYPTLHYLPQSTAIFITDVYDQSGGVLLNYLKLNQIIPEHVLIVSVTVANHPYVLNNQRYQLMSYNKNIYRITLHYGFMDSINVPEALVQAELLKLFSFKLNIEKATFLIEIPSVIATRRKRTLLFYWQERLFAFLMRNAALDIEFFKLPYDRTIGVGAYCEM